jgi:hypothetical protein
VAQEDIGLAAFESWQQSLAARSFTGESVFLSVEVGTVLDPEDRERYHLFPDVPHFRTARVLARERGDYRLEVTVASGDRDRVLSREISVETLRLLRLHLWLTEAYQDRRHAAGPLAEEERLRLVALRYAAFGRYDLVAELLDDLALRYPSQEQGRWAQDYLADVREMAADSRLPFQPLSLAHADSGRNDLKLFGGFYGLWLGIAVPIALEADSPEAFGVGLLLGGPLGWGTAAALSRNTDMTEGRASIISLGGWLGTWQGLGWSSLNDNLDGHQVVGYGVLGGLAGIAAASALTSKVEFTEGHGELTHSANLWGAWFGIVAGVLLDHQNDDLLRFALIGSDALVLGTGLATKGSPLKEKQVRLVNLAGLMGGVMGLGIILIAQPEDETGVMAILGLSSLTGLIVGYTGMSNTTATTTTSAIPAGTRPWDLSRAAAKPLPLPQLVVYRDLTRRGRLIPAVGVTIGF